jgi:tetratricopeptide (TPR) repeat protein
MAPGSRLQELTAKYMQNPRRFFVPLANEYRKNRDLDRAIALCREHLSSQPGHMSGHIVLARAYYEKGDVAAAREVFLTSVELDDENLIALRHLGDIARSNHDLAEARQWYARVLDADPQNEEIERLLRSLSTAEPGIEPAPAAPTPMPFDEPEAPAAESAGADLESALADPTPPGLRAIVTPPVVPAIIPGHPPAGLEDPRRTLERLDPEQLGSVEPVEHAAGIVVDDGVGFMFDELDALVDPAATVEGASLPPVAEADFSAGIATPTTPSAPVGPTPGSDDLLSKPAYGALASFASWRSAQERDTPAVPLPSQPAPADAGARDGASSETLFGSSVGSDAASTAPEFVTETMAALYARQGFVAQAIEVYHALLSKAPGDQNLIARLAELREIPKADDIHASLQEDADKALAFDDLGDLLDADDEAGSMLETMYTVSPPAGRDDAPFAGTQGWEGDDATQDDWFADAPSPDLGLDPRGGSDEFFGVSVELFGRPTGVANSDATVAGPHGSPAPLTTLFGAPTVIGADDVAADMLHALATQMVGRLPKEAPTLPVPDILELPAPLPGDEIGGATPAPLLSFDRFFSGSGAPPRPRMDTPVVRAEPIAPRSSAAAPVVPSLSPTFGGVPVIPPSTPVVAPPAAWGGFDQFLPPVPAPPAAAPAAVPPTTPEPEFLLPELLEPAPAEPMASVSEPTTAQDSGAGESNLPAFFTPPTAFAPPVAPEPVAERAPEAQAERPEPSPTVEPPTTDRRPPSDFHRWLEGLS